MNLIAKLLAALFGARKSSKPHKDDTYFRDASNAKARRDVTWPTRDEPESLPLPFPETSGSAPAPIEPPAPIEQPAPVTPRIVRLSTYFTLDEMIYSPTALRRRIDNTPPPGIIDNMRRTARCGDKVREGLGFPMILTSGYRCPALNYAIGGADESAHMKGWAMDFVCPDFGTPYDVARAIEMLDVMDEVDQLILEYGRWVHISFDPRKRGEVFTLTNLKGKLPGIQKI